MHTFDNHIFINLYIINNYTYIIFKKLYIHILFKKTFYYYFYINVYIN